MNNTSNLETKPWPAIFTMLVTMIAATLACGIYYRQTPPAPTATLGPLQTPKVGERVLGVECQPATLDMLHGETKEIVLVDAGGESRATHFKIGSVVGPAEDPGASEIEVSQTSSPNQDGWSPLPGTVRIYSKAIHGPSHIKTYNFNILLGVDQEGNFTTSGNILCVVNVQHLDLSTATFTPTFTPTITPTLTVTPSPTVLPTRTPEKIKPSLTVTSPVKIGETLYVRGLNFPPGPALKWLINPKGKVLYQKDAPIPDTGSFSAPFPVSGPVGIWTVVVKYAGGEVRATFEVIK